MIKAAYPEVDVIGGNIATAEAAISALFASERCEDLPLERLATATGLDSVRLDALIAFMDDENKLMCRKGIVYLI